jgi:two-component system chemotaxis response regulator CheB
VDVLFRSVAGVYSDSAIAIILTGMGSDGAKGLGPLKRSGAYVIAQDESTSVVWGMPGAAAATNQVDEILPLERIGAAVASLLAPGTTP